MTISVIFLWLFFKFKKRNVRIFMEHFWSTFSKTKRYGARILLLEHTPQWSHCKLWRHISLFTFAWGLLLSPKQRAALIFFIVLVEDPCLPNPIYRPLCFQKDGDFRGNRQGQNLDKTNFWCFIWIARPIFFHCIYSFLLKMINWTKKNFMEKAWTMHLAITMWNDANDICEKCPYS